MRRQKRGGRPPRGERVAGPWSLGDGRWQVLYHSPAGKRVAKTYRDEGAARAAARRLRDDIATDHRTAEAALTAYVAAARARGLRPRTTQIYESAIRHLLGPHHEEPLVDLTRARLARRIDNRMVVEGLSVDAAASAVRACRTWLRWCGSRGYLPARQVEQLLELQVDGRRKRGKPQLTVDEARAFMAAAVQMGGEGPAAALCPLLLGLRAREVLDRRVRDLDDGGALLWVWSGKTEAARRRVEVPEPLRAMLLEVAAGRAPGARLFGRGPARSNNWLGGWVRKVCEAAMVPVVCPHGLRGTHATLAEAAGLSSHLVAQNLGHTSPEITGRHYTAPGTRAAVNQRVVLEVISGGRR